MPSIMEASRRSLNKVSVTVLDNGSIDKSISYLNKEFPDVDVFFAPKNLLLVSYNDFLKMISEPVVILLNNDVFLKPDCIDYLLEHFNNDKIFFVAPRIMDGDGMRVTGGCMDFIFRAGIFCNKLKTCARNNYSFFVGSSAAYDRIKFLSLGGYDPIYLPGTYEDLDLCYRAWQRGWTGICDERSVVFHRDSSSFSKAYGDKKRQAISARNAYICVWKNAKDIGMIFSSIAWYPFLLLFNILRMRFDLADGAVQALTLIPKIAERRRQASHEVNRSEKEIKKIFLGK